MFQKDHPFIIAEVGFNHGGDVELAKTMIQSAADAGADAVKLQTYLASELALETAPHYELIKSGELDLQAHEELFDYAKQRDIFLFSTPFGQHSIDLLEKVDTAAYKIASMDATNIPMIRTIAELGKPILLSTGMATLPQIDAAVAAIKECGNEQLTLLHCISHYPVSPENACLGMIKILQERYGLPTGYSDHALGIAPSLAAIALGATVIEKHFTTDRTLDGPDHAHSSDPEELSQIVKLGRETLLSIQCSANFDTRPDLEQAKAAQRSIHSAIDINVGTTLSGEHIRAVRPGDGIPPSEIPKVLGRVANQSIPAGTKLKFSQFE